MYMHIICEHKKVFPCYSVYWNSAKTQSKHVKCDFPFKSKHTSTAIYDHDHHHHDFLHIFFLYLYVHVYICSVCKAQKEKKTASKASTL